MLYTNSKESRGKSLASTASTSKVMLLLQQHRPSFGLVCYTHLFWHINNTISKRETRIIKSSSAKSKQTLQNKGKPSLQPMGFFPGEFRRPAANNSSARTFRSEATLLFQRACYSTSCCHLPTCFRPPACQVTGAQLHDLLYLHKGGKKGSHACQ